MGTKKEKMPSKLAKKYSEDFFGVFVGFSQLEMQMNLILNEFFIKSRVKGLMRREFWEYSSLFQEKLHLVGTVAEHLEIEFSKKKLKKCAEL